MFRTQLDPLRLSRVSDVRARDSRNRTNHFRSSTLVAQSNPPVDHGRPSETSYRKYRVVRPIGLYSASSNMSRISRPSADDCSFFAVVFASRVVRISVFPFDVTLFLYGQYGLWKPHLTVKVRHRTRPPRANNRLKRNSNLSPKRSLCVIPCAYRYPQRQ